MHFLESITKYKGRAEDYLLGCCEEYKETDETFRQSLEVVFVDFSKKVEPKNTASI